LRQFEGWRLALASGVFLCVFVVGGCGLVLPDLNPIAGSQPDPKNPYSISINEVVKRVKCEIWDAIKDRPEKEYPWFNKWVVQADLTLTVNDSSSLNPGATFIQPLTTASIPLRVTNMARSASLGVGGGDTNTAFRTEIVSFSMSIPELRKEFEKPTPEMIVEYNDCHPYGAIDLTGNLGLAEWVNSAFGPVDNGLLKEGPHSPPKAPPGTQGGAPPPPKGANVSRLLTRQAATSQPPVPDDFPPNLKRSINIIYDEYNVLMDALKFIGTADNDVSGMTSSNQYFAELLLDLQAQIKKLKDDAGVVSPKILPRIESYASKMENDITPRPGSNLQRLKSIIDDSNALLSPLAAQISQDLAPVIPIVQLQCDCNPTPTDTTKGAAVLKCLNTMQSTVKLLNPPKPELDPPIDAISHQVSFEIALTVSANPTWTLVHFKGPSPSSGNFASLSESNTHNLTIVMGAPGSPAAANSRSALTLSSAIATQLAPQLGSTPMLVP
jgi:hypothetical protein